MTVKQLYAGDDAEIIRKALELYAKTLEQVAEDLTEIDERYERADVLAEAHAARVLSYDFR